MALWQSLIAGLSEQRDTANPLAITNTSGQTTTAHHSRASRLAHGAVYATYVGTWRKRFRITAGEREINRFEETETGAVRSFCRCCGTPLIYERTRSRHMINIPRALFQSRTGRHPIYHIAIEEMQDWAYAGEPLVPLKGYPGVFWKRSKKKSRVQQATSASIR